ncbi:MAG TPA: hypothetical protein VMT62_05195 [Syntrophorhabdaceae bacterium]|nr:hypothetical protein [Syntrophorhabdaceae bacterium]
MKRKILFVSIILLASALAAPYAFCGEMNEPYSNGSSSGESMLFDLLFLRPLGIAACAIGTAGAIVSLPFTIPTGTAGDAVKALVTAPGNYTFVRPLGQLEPPSSNY